VRVRGVVVFGVGAGFLGFVGFLGAGCFGVVFCAGRTGFVGFVGFLGGVGGGWVAVAACGERVVAGGAGRAGWLRHPEPAG
jgi:hypothetical protein